MSTAHRLTLIGNTPSPYTRKMLALLRYRRIPYAMVWDNPTEVLQAKGIEQPKVALLPTFIFEDKDAPYAMVDSTPIIRKLEQSYEGRSVLPTDPALAFIDYLLEDFADEWVTKYMFHYRWHPPEDADNAGTLLPFCMDPSMPADKQQWAKDYFTKRQVDRLYVVGSSDTTAAIIDASYRRFLQAMEAHLANQAYLLGNRPGAADFAVYGQLTSLVGFDPTPRKIAHQVSPRTVAWATRVGDLSGLEPLAGDWRALADQPDSLQAILNEVGRVYAPALLANAQALQAGDKQWEAQIDGKPWVQQTFPYQGKCLQWINQQYQSLSEVDKQQVDARLSGTGCEQIIVKA
ncbi:MAG: glutathione S-transferase family protein [Gammaproteobacteria bacterium]|nr:glutathione S-transferase family protein [Gammaproteobacteria bacterium]